MEANSHCRSLPCSIADEDDDQTHELNKVSSTPPLPALASFSLSSFLLPSLSSRSNLSPFYCHLKLPSQLSSFSLRSSSSTLEPSSKFSTPSSTSRSLLFNPLPLFRHRSSDPSHAAAARRRSLVWFRADLRLHDNEALSAASRESISLLPVYLFDPRDYGKSSSGFDKTGPHQARFLLESVADLRLVLRGSGSDLIVRVGRPEVLLPELARAVGADTVYAHREVSRDDVVVEERVAEAMEAEGVEVKYFWGNTLYHIDDIPFDIEEMPSDFGGFREKVKGLALRKTIEAPEYVKRLPSRGNVEPGEIPSLKELGLNPAPGVSQDSKPVVSAALSGGETEALERLKIFVAEWRAQPNKKKNSTPDSICRTNFSCKISPWMGTGCLSPRLLFEELKKATTRTFSAASHKSGSSGVVDGMSWLMFELMWRDFFRFIARKHSAAKKKADVVAAPACTGAVV